MTFKIFIYGIFFMIFAVSCNKQITDPETMTSPTAGLKAGALGHYYVAKTGNDNNAGTSAAPFLTLSKASQVAVAGDSVIVRDGTYTSTAEYMNEIYCSGTAGNYIVFKSEHKYGAVFDGNNVSSYGFSMEYGASYLKFIDFEVKNFLGFGFTFGHDKISSYITIQGCKIRDIGRPATTSDYGRCAVFIPQGHHHITIDKNLMYNIGRTGPSTYWLNKDHAVYIGDPYPDVPANASHHNIITDNLIYNNSGAAITMGSNNDLIANNVMAWSNENSMGGGCFIAATSTGCFNETIANNIFYQPPTGNAFAMVSYAGYSGWSVKNNMVYGGRMWDPSSASGYAAVMAGGNYGQKDCENGEVNPSFVSAVRSNAPNVDFSLQATSTAINKGANVGLTSDFLKNTMVGTPDIGAYEFAGSNPTPAPTPAPAPTPTTTTTPTTTVYYNSQTSATATKNNCGIGYNGSTVTYTVAANKYSSNTSQADANNKAIADLNLNKQANANAYGTCTAATKTYFNVAITVAGTKNDCSTGRTGSKVTGTLAARTYSSTISQADADNQALVYVNANKQAYFNANGVCR
jgi:hypothetical protein